MKACRFLWICLVLAFCVCALSRCYYVRQAVGQMSLLASSREIEEVLASEDLTPEQKARLRLILDVKEYAEREIGLAPSDNYTTYYDVEEGHVSYMVSACAKDSFTPYIWSFPIVGSLPYKGFFDLEDAQAEARSLAEAGYDVALRPVSAYSTLGWFSDPVLSTMLDRTEEDLVNLVLHELTHSTVYLEGRADFNESLASFVGTTATLHYLRTRFAPDSPPYERAIGVFADRESFGLFVEELHVRLDGLYRSDVSDEEKLRKRERIFKDAQKKKYPELRKRLNTERYDYFEFMELNNAEILMERRYNDDAPFRAVWEEAEGNWEMFWNILREEIVKPDAPILKPKS
ncbi:MAG: aminopeptidase [Planctomycetota bacterium]